MEDLTIWVTGGYFDNSGECFICEVDIRNQKKSDVIRFLPPENLLVPCKGFTGATWAGLAGKSDFLVCGFCALFRFSPPDWKLSGILHQPCMNDLHHVAVNNKKIFIVNTGLEAIDIFDEHGNFLGSHSFQPAWINRERQSGISPSTEEWPKLVQAGWQERTFSITDVPPKEDYYQHHKANFHQKILRDFVHINHVTVLQNQVLVTSLSDRCVYNMHNFAKVIESTPSHPHDGFIHNDNFWITCVDGTIVAYKMKNGNVTNNVVYSNNLFDHTEHRGWCRGIMVRDNCLIVGITAIQKSTQYHWAPYPWDITKTGILCWDLSQNELLSFMDLSETRGSKVFSIIEPQ